MITNHVNYLGYLPVTTWRTGYKVLKQRLIGGGFHIFQAVFQVWNLGPLVENHYIRPMERQFRKLSPEFLSEQEERDADAYERRKRRGIVPPKKGQGKRSSKGGKK